MSLYNKASLIQVPSLYKDGLLVSTVPEDRSGDFTFTRGSNLSATRVGPNSYIEKGYENLLLQSNSFLTSPWGKARASLTSNQLGYDGSNDAWLLESNESGQTRVNQNVSATNLHTISVYAKKGSVNHILLFTIGTNSGRYFNLETGSVGSVWSTPPIDAQIESVGNDWYRCSIVLNGSTTAFWIYPTSVDGNADSSVGDNIYIQDAMLNQGLVAYPYIETTTAPVAGGILEDEPRIDFSDGCGHLLLEPSRTNLIKYSEYFLNYPWTTNSSLTSNYGVSPEGVQNSTRVEFSGSSKYLVYPFGGNPAYGTIYVKGTNGETINFGAGNVAGGSLFTLNGDWQRIGFYNDGTAAYYSINTYNGATARDIEIYGAQLEQDATYPTSYIPTYGVSQTRLRDFGETSDISAGIGNTEGVLYAEFKYFDSGVNQSITINGGSSSDRFGFYVNGSNELYALSANTTLDLNQDTGTTLVHGTTYKLAIRYDGGNIDFFLSGGSTPIYSTTGINVSTALDRVSTSNAIISTFMSSTNQILLFPTALSDSECIALTSL